MNITPESDKLNIQFRNCMI